MPTNEELLAVLQKIHEIARNEFDRCKDNAYGLDSEYWYGITEVTRAILELIEPLGVTYFPIAIGDRLACPNCKTDLYLRTDRTVMAGGCRNVGCIVCTRCQMAGPIREMALGCDVPGDAWNRMVTEMQI